jgi:hypothetical protein
MFGKRVSENGKRVSEGGMSSVALNEAKKWADDLLDAESTGRKDREGPIRFRLARKIGVPESYLYRLQYKTDEMNDVKGSVYRALMLAHQAYVRACERNEEAADRNEAERLSMRKIYAVDHKPASAGQFEDHARD